MFWFLEGLWPLTNLLFGLELEPTSFIAALIIVQVLIIPNSVPALSRPQIRYFLLCLSVLGCICRVMKTSEMLFSFFFLSTHGSPAASATYTRAPADPNSLGVWVALGWVPTLAEAAQIFHTAPSFNHLFLVAQHLHPADAA